MHGFGGFWGMIAVGLFARKDEIAGGFSQYDGFVWNGETYLLKIQLLSALLLTVWAMSSTYVLLFLIDLICPIRMAEHMELLGADYCEHNVYHPGVGVTRAVSVLQHIPKFTKHVDLSLKIVGHNYGHQACIEEYKKQKISVFKDNPVHKRIRNAAEAINDVVGGLMGRTTAPENEKSIGLDDINDISVSEINSPAPITRQGNLDTIDYAL